MRVVKQIRLSREVVDAPISGNIVGQVGWDLSNLI